MLALQMWKGILLIKSLDVQPGEIGSIEGNLLGWVITWLQIPRAFFLKFSAI
jgi:hypothetical protein